MVHLTQIELAKNILKYNPKISYNGFNFKIKEMKVSL